MRLVIAEKPSVAQSIAAVLGAKSRHDGYLEGSGYIVSWCFGHLAELADAAVYNADDAKWTLAALPIIPISFRFIVRSEKQKQFDILRELVRREDVAEVVNACDAGREGELIFRTVYCLAGCSKPILRLWISSMEDDAIRSGFQQLKSGRDYDGLHQSALCRAKADWLVGINATRYFSLTYGRTLNIGRVMSPTLALLVQREAEISAFVAEPFYTVQLDCGFPATTGRMKDRKDADAIANACKGKAVTVKSVERKEKSEKAPALYDLTSLQRDANRVLGYTSQQTLDYLQALYEKKLCTYPRTDSRYLTDDMEGSVPGLVAAAAAVCGATASASVSRVMVWACCSICRSFTSSCPCSVSMVACKTEITPSTSAVFSAFLVDGASTKPSTAPVNWLSVVDGAISENACFISFSPSTSTINLPSTVAVNPCKLVDSGSRLIFLKTACFDTPISSAICRIVFIPLRTGPQDTRP
mgnify:CR=1 FL=1